MWLGVIRLFFRKSQSCWLSHPTKKTIFQFLDGNKNEASVSIFLVQLASKYDLLEPIRRNDSVFLMDNCPSHKTSIVRKDIYQLQIPVLFSGPALFLATSVEEVFAAIKMRDNSIIKAPTLDIHELLIIRKLTNKQRLMAKFS